MLYLIDKSSWAMALRPSGPPSVGLLRSGTIPRIRLQAPGASVKNDDDDVADFGP